AVAGVRGRRHHRRQVVLRVAEDADDRVDDQVDAVATAVELHSHRVDEERHVVGDDLDGGVGRAPAVLVELRVVDADLRRAERARLAADHRYDEWAALEADAREYFGGRESGALDDADRARIAAWTAGGGDSLEAVAWAIDVVGSESYRADWRDFLGGGRHMLS